MPTANDTQQQKSTATDPSSAPPPPDDAPDKDAAAQAAADTGDENLQVTTNSGKVLQFTSTSIGKLKREEREKGQLKLAKELGFASVEEMKAALAARRNAPPARANTPTPRRDDRRSNTHHDRRPAPPATADRADTASSSPQPPRHESHRDRRARQQAEEKAARLARDKARSEKALREARRRNEELEASLQLKLIATRCGIVDVDYAVDVLLKRHLAGKAQEELAKFDEAAWFRGLRRTHPVLFGETQRLAATSPADPDDAAAKAKAARAPATAPRTAPNNPQQGPNNNDAANGAIDARKLSNTEFEKLLAARGLANPNAAPSYSS